MRLGRSQVRLGRIQLRLGRTQGCIQRHIQGHIQRHDRNLNHDHVHNHIQDQIQAVNENAEQLLTNVELMDLVTYNEDAIGQENIKVIESTLGKIL